MIPYLHSLAIIAASFLYINEPVVNMREHPSLESEVVSQAVFAEKISVYKQRGNWVAIRTTDGYHGWVLSDAIVSRQDPYLPTIMTSRLAAHIYDRANVKYGPIQTVPYGTMLQVLGVEDQNWIKIALPDNRDGYVQRGNVTEGQQIISRTEMIDLSQKFLGIPYMWGGRSSFGYDCSGFIQMLYRKIGIHLPRDAAQQIKDKKLQIIPVEKTNPGDLIFFGQSSKEIRHVGMYIGNGKFIHASNQINHPWISISNITDDMWSGSTSSNYPYRVGAQYKMGEVINH